MKMTSNLKRGVTLLALVGLAVTTLTVIKNSAYAKDLVSSSAKPNPQMSAVLDELTKLGPKPLETLTAEEARRQATPADAVHALLKKKNNSYVALAPEEVGKVVNQTIPAGNHTIPVRIYTPKGQGPFPVIVYYHGGGWVIANLDTYDATPRGLVNKTNAIVISAHYRQGPEHKFPAAHDDALSTYKWALQHAQEINGDTKRIALVGESAGGNLAASVSYMSREQHLRMPIYQVLVYPIAGYNFDTPSYIENTNAAPLSKNGMKWFFKNYLNNPNEGQSPLITLKNQKNLSGLPPTTLITAQIDPLRSEGKEYAEALSKAGVPLQYKNYDGVSHEFFGMAAVVDKAQDAQKFAAEGLNQAFKH